MIPLSRTDDIRATVEQMVTNAYPDTTAMGAVVFLVRNGQIFRRSAAGLASLEHQVPMQPGMPFGLA